MENAITDQNFVPSLLAVLNTDTTQGENLVRIKINASNGGVMTNIVDTISFTMEPINSRDENYRNVATFQGSDGEMYPWVANADGEVLIDN